VVADPLQIARHLDRADEEAQVARHRLLEREQLHRRALDLELEAVELAVAGDHGVGRRGVARQQRLDRQLDERLGALAHRQQAPLEVGQLLVEVAVAARGGAAQGERHPNRPVM
jgi:hypothetical protein